jgi:hypothetical protein
MEGPTSPWGLRNRITRLTLREHDDDDDNDDDDDDDDDDDVNTNYMSLTLFCGSSM